MNAPEYWTEMAVAWDNIARAAYEEGYPLEAEFFNDISHNALDMHDKLLGHPTF